MSEKKNLMINCDVCDARNAKEEYLSGYEQIMISTDLLLVSDESRGVLERLPAICNTDNTLEVDDNANLIFKMGVPKSIANLPFQQIPSSQLTGIC